MSTPGEQTPSPETPTEGAPEGTPEVSATGQNLRPEEQAALQKAREGLTPTNPHEKPDGRPQRPEGVPEKFWDAEKGEVRVDALTSSYAELEAKLSAGAPKEGEGEGTEEGDDAEVKGGKITKKAEEAPAEGEGDETPELTGIIGTAAEEFAADGAFGEETAEKLAKAGIPPEVQNIYLAGLQALQEKQTATVYEYVGGEENYTAMAQWAAKTLSDDELNSFNAALDNPALAQNAVLGLQARFKTARPSEGRQVAPQNGAPDQGDIFQSRGELTKAMSDPRYKNDPAYQRSVVEKLARTRKAGKSYNG